MVASRHRRELSHFSIESPGAYRMGVVNLISFSERTTLRVEDPEVDPFVSSALEALFELLTASAEEGRDISRSCWRSLRERDRPVPS